ncbi:hypothetical protein DL93DRAFT_2078228 [Clavulina sp. PMI_390]|nr:hypothetical protein DL93DRAFT_2078228 [Clavulina sp. PMI_390]
MTFHLTDTSGLLSRTESFTTITDAAIHPPHNESSNPETSIGVTETSSLLGPGPTGTPDDSLPGLPRPSTDAKRQYNSISQRSGSRAAGSGVTWVKFKQRAQYYVPALEWIPNYKLSMFWGDLAAGVSVASVLIPQSMSYATSLAHLDASTGLFASAVPGIMYALFGTCRQLNVGPEAALSLLVGQTISALLTPDEHPHEGDGKLAAEAISTIVVFQVGLISFVLGMLRLGFLDVVLSRALLRGFITAVAVIIMVEQLIPMLGLELLQHTVADPPVTVPEKVLFILEHLDKAFSSPRGRLTVAISFGSLAALLILRWAKRKVARKGGRWAQAIYLPEVFVVVVMTTVFSDVYDWHKQGVSTLGLVKLQPGEIFDFPINSLSLNYLQKTTSTALLISIAGFLDSISAAKQNAARFQYSISPNRELVALGAGNLLASFIPGTLPAYGSITRSKMNGDAGGRTQMASLVCSALVILSVWLLLPALRFLPKCVLAAVIGLVVNSILAESPHEIKYYWKMSAWTDLFMMLLTFVFTVFWSVEVGIIVSVCVSLILIVRRSSKPHINILGRVPGTDRWKPIHQAPEYADDDAPLLPDNGEVDEVVQDADMVGSEQTPGVLIVRVRDDLDFANTGQLKERLRRLELYGPQKAHPSTPARRRTEMRALVFHMADVEVIDASATQIILEVCQTYKARNVQVHFAHLLNGHLENFHKAGIVPDVVPLTRVHQNVASAMGAIEYDFAGTMNF